METLEEILEKIKQYEGVSTDDDDDDDSPGSCLFFYFYRFLTVSSRADSFWRELFLESFVAEKSDDKQDDLLFFIYKLNSKLASKLRSCADPVVSVKWGNSLFTL